MIVFSFAVASYYLQWFVNSFHEYNVSTTIETTTASLSEVGKEIE